MEPIGDEQNLEQDVVEVYEKEQKAFTEKEYEEFAEDIRSMNIGYVLDIFKDLRKYSDFKITPELLKKGRLPQC